VLSDDDEETAAAAVGASVTLFLFSSVLKRKPKERKV